MYESQDAPRRAGILQTISIYILLSSAVIKATQGAAKSAERDREGDEMRTKTGIRST